MDKRVIYNISEAELKSIISAYLKIVDNKYDEKLSVIKIQALNGAQCVATTSFQVLVTEKK